MKFSIFYFVLLNVEFLLPSFGPGKIMYTFSAKCMRISAPHQASVGRASRQRSGKRKSAYIRRKTYTLIYPCPQAWSEIQLFVNSVKKKKNHVCTVFKFNSAIKMATPFSNLIFINLGPLAQASWPTLYNSPI
jgi:hypothetical protein